MVPLKTSFENMVFRIGLIEKLASINRMFLGTVLLIEPTIKKIYRVSPLSEPPLKLTSYKKPSVSSWATTHITPLGAHFKAKMLQKIVRARFCTLKH